MTWLFRHQQKSDTKPIQCMKAGPVKLIQSRDYLLTWLAFSPAFLSSGRRVKTVSRYSMATIFHFGTRVASTEVGCTGQRVLHRRYNISKVLYPIS